MSIHHIFHTVGNHIARGQRVEHTVVAHSYTVVDGDGVEFGSEASQTLYFGLNNLPDFVQVGVTRHKLGERVHYGNDGLAHLLFFHSVSHPQGSCARHASTIHGHVAS